MANPFYKKHVVTLVNAFRELDGFTDELRASELQPERVRAIEMYERVLVLLKTVDTIPLPKKVRMAARDVGDYAYLLSELLRTQAKPTKTMVIPAATEAQKYSDEGRKTTVRLNKRNFEKMRLYRAKAAETLRQPSLDYGQAHEKVLAEAL